MSQRNVAELCRRDVLFKSVLEESGTKSVLGTCYREVMEKSVVECGKEVLEKRRRTVLQRSVGQGCCREVLEKCRRNVVEKCWTHDREVLDKGVVREVLGKCHVGTCWRRVFHRRMSQ